MRIAMTGGGGFIGSHLLSRMIASGMDVTLVGAGIGKSRYTASLVARGEVRFLRCDTEFRQQEILRRALQDVDALVLLGHVMPASTAT
ncbi:MAG TPA: NAD-dependent epimerase/dehydratase family protein, partial [Candidatus Limnocylindria bacterium]|nr:NAD-dependent epimerase/dehydratase family protein [Candidatus Limnocylindria bacterium]